MTAFVILAAGRGTRMGRVGDELPKCLMPLDGRAVLSHQFELAPPSARVIVCVGYRAEQVREYIAHAHPLSDVELVDVPGWDGQHAGPGASLLAARDVVGDDDLMFTSCDTLWAATPLLRGASWMALAPQPSGTDGARWCRVVTYAHDVLDVIDKEPGRDEVRTVYTGLGYITREDLDSFWAGVESGDERAGERQVSGGFTALLDGAGELRAEMIHWVDVGDEEAYRQAVARTSGYDWTKLGQATYVLPESDRVVKFHSDSRVVYARSRRGRQLHELGAVARTYPGTTMMSCDYVEGVTAYQKADAEPHSLPSGIGQQVLTWVDAFLRDPVYVDDDDYVPVCALKFYRDKTLQRIELLPAAYRHYALRAVYRIDWNDLAAGCQPVVWHGDLNYGNIIVSPDGRLFGIDWREHFAGELDWGDARYDVAKLLAGTVVHWDNARRGDFRPWERGEHHAQLIRDSRLYEPECEVIGALSLLNSAPLHAPPLDEILVARGCAWLDEALQ